MGAGKGIRVAKKGAPWTGEKGTWNPGLIVGLGGGNMNP